MKDEQMMGMHKGGGHVFMTVGVLALVYGLMTWLVMAYSWPVYMGWVVGGVVLIVIGWIKKAMKKM